MTIAVSDQKKVGTCSSLRIPQLSSYLLRAISPRWKIIKTCIFDIYSRHLYFTFIFGIYIWQLQFGNIPHITAQIWNITPEISNITARGRTYQFPDITLQNNNITIQMLFPPMLSKRRENHVCQHRLCRNPPEDHLSQHSVCKAKCDRTTIASQIEICDLDM